MPNQYKEERRLQQRINRAFAAAGFDERVRISHRYKTFYGLHSSLRIALGPYLVDGAGQILQHNLDLKHEAHAFGLQ
jgi:hypothetical protein